MSDIVWELPALLWALPLALLPFVYVDVRKSVVWLKLTPVDPLSRILTPLLKLAASLLIALLVMALAGPHIPEQLSQRSGEGAEIIILVDRSRSMDDIFAAAPRNTLSRVPIGTQSKRQVSRDYLIEFIQRRPDDRFGYVFFSNHSTELLSLTYHKDAVMATVDAGALGRGISQTNIVEALLKAADMFEHEIYRGARRVLLISDGGQLLTEQEESFIRQRYQALQLGIIWIYLPAMRGMTLEPSDQDNFLWLDMPERKLHEFFKTLSIPYQAFEAGSLSDFADAIDAIDQQHYETLMVDEVQPRKSLADRFLLFALMLAGLLAAIQAYSWWGAYLASRP
ncbi:vWA domain-containing protein [Methylophaga lonarensis]|uniref:vWA domain-containing protein n=1 Tax=Methylophaga lonarensis TaxID=999151 RepID=UPI003D2C5840